MIPLGLLARDEYLREPHNLQALSEGYEVHDFSDWREFSPRQLLDACRSVEVIVTGRGSPHLPEELVEDMGRLRYLCHLHGTIRHLVSKRHLEAGLIVSNWGDASPHMAEGAMALLLTVLKQIPSLDAFTRGGPDQRIHQAFGCTLLNMDVGLYGYGPIGRHHARMLEVFGTKIAIYDPYARDVPAHIRVCSSLRELFATCQAVCIHCGLNDQTRDSVSGEMLDLLPQGGVVINTARGPIVDEQALADRVAAGRLLAGLDVIRDEKNWPASPLAGLRGAVLTRHHIGSGKGYPPDQAPPRRIASHARENLQAWRQQRPLKHVITAEMYDLKT